VASKRNVRRKACAGKVRYESIAAAEFAAASGRRKTAEWIIGYGCKFCGGFHIGHPPAKVRQAIKAKQG